MIENSCCFFGVQFDINGNYILSSGFNKYFIEIIINLIENHNVTHFISGMGIETGIFAAETILKLKHMYPNIILECAIPYETQTIRWSTKMRDKYYNILEKCDKETMLQKQYTITSKQLCNKYMINNSYYVMLVWNGRINSKNMVKIIKYAKSADRQIIIINLNIL